MNFPTVPDASSLLPENESLGFLLSDTTRLARRLASCYLERHGITLAQARALLCVCRWEGIRQVELADYLEIQPISVGRLLDQLAQAGFIQRRPDPNDRRAFKLYLTAAAAPTIALISQGGRDFQKEMLAGLSTDEVDALFKGLNKVRENLNNRAKHPSSTETTQEVNE
jgi:DNA-binding MarR family transcriptional regulator